eukprot:355096-Chlamydomonas_euryale.AAC.5
MTRQGGSVECGRVCQHATACSGGRPVAQRNARARCHFLHWLTRGNTGIPLAATADNADSRSLSRPLARGMRAAGSIMCVYTRKRSIAARRTLPSRRKCPPGQGVPHFQCTVALPGCLGRMPGCLGHTLGAILHCLATEGACLAA